MDKWRPDQIEQTVTYWFGGDLSNDFVQSPTANGTATGAHQANHTSLGARFLVLFPQKLTTFVWLSSGIVSYDIQLYLNNVLAHTFAALVDGSGIKNFTLKVKPLDTIALEHSAGDNPGFSLFALH